MCNCGNKRESLAAQPATSNNADMMGTDPVKKQMQQAGAGVNFVYTGQSALSATGNVTGKRYRFSAPGEMQLVDYRDASSMMTVPVLKRVE